MNYKQYLSASLSFLFHSCSFGLVTAAQVQGKMTVNNKLVLSVLYTYALVVKIRGGPKIQRSRGTVFPQELDAPIMPAPLIVPSTQDDCMATEPRFPKPREL